MNKSADSSPPLMSPGWYFGLFVFSTPLIPAPVFAIILMPLTPVFIAAMILPFIFRAIAVQAFKSRCAEPDLLKRFRRGLTLTMVSGGIVGILFWWMVAKIVLSGVQWA